MNEHEKRLRESLAPSMLHHLEVLLAEKAEEKSRARAEALEEAAQKFDAVQGNIGGARAAKLVRSLISASAPASIPVERVREAVNTLSGEEPYTAYPAARKFGLTLLKRLGVPLDAATEGVTDHSACPAWCRRPPGHPGAHSVYSLNVDPERASDDAATEAPLPVTACGKRFADGVCRQWDGHEGAHQYETPDDVATEPHPDAIAPERNLCGLCGKPASQHSAGTGRIKEAGRVVCHGFRHVEQEGSKP